MKTLPKLFLASCLLTQSLCFAATESVDRIVAIVNNDVITSSELTHQTDLVKIEIQRAKQKPPSDLELKKQVLQHIVDLNLQLQYASKAGIVVTESQINDNIEKIATRNHISVAAMKTQLAREGISYEEYRENLRKQMIISQLQQETIAKQIHISEDEVTNFMKTPRTGNAEDMLYEIDDIIVPLNENPTTKEIQAANSEAGKLVHQLKKGAEFSSVAVPKSLGWRTLAEIPDVFASQIVKLSPGQFAGPIRTGNGLHIIKLVAKKSDSINAKISAEQAREMIFRRRFEERAELWVQQLRARSYVKMMLDAPSDLA